jgi:hypothetical protein
MLNTNLWNKIVTSIPPPPREKQVWSQNKNNRLSVAIIEPRCHELLAGVLYNMADIYGGQDVSLYIFHGEKNESYVNKIIDQWTGVNLINLHVDNLALYEYNDLLVTIKFWENFTSTHVLIFQVDTLILRPFDDCYFQYDYIGAPWIHAWAGGGKYVGNGGFSLRNVEAMKNICHQYGETYGGVNEDFFFVARLPRQKVAPCKIAMTFAVEEIYYHGPCGLHKSYQYLTTIELTSLLLQLPHLSQDARQTLVNIFPNSMMTRTENPLLCAKYGGNGTYIDVTHTFFWLMKQGYPLFKVSNYLFGDPALMIPKTLIIEFSDGSQAVFNENDNVCMPICRM